MDKIIKLLERNPDCIFSMFWDANKRVLRVAFTAYKVGTETALQVSNFIASEKITLTKTDLLERTALRLAMQIGLKNA